MLEFHSLRHGHVPRFRPGVFPSTAVSERVEPSGTSTTTDVNSHAVERMQRELATCCDCLYG